MRVTYSGCMTSVFKNSVNVLDNTISACQYSIVKAHRRYEHAKYQCHTRLDPDGRVAAIANAEQNAEIHNLFIATYGHGIDVSIY